MVGQVTFSVGTTIEQMELPSVEDVNDQRVARFNDRISAALAA